jgi:NADH:ubiquinone oxidoreductase subunit
MLQKCDLPPSQDAVYVPREWERPHQPNPTGTPLAYRPKGSILRGDPRSKAADGYQPWTPGA